MHETAEDLRDLQRALDESYAAAGEHLRSIFRTERRMSAAEVVRVLRGVFVLSLATVTAKGEPMVAPIDGLFYRGRIWFGVPPGALRAVHLRTRPQVSAAYVRGEKLCVIVHGVAREVEASHPMHEPYERYCREAYGPELRDHWAEQYSGREGRGFTAWIEPRRLYASALVPEALED